MRKLVLAASSACCCESYSESGVPVVLLMQVVLFRDPMAAAPFRLSASVEVARADEQKAHPSRSDHPACQTDRDRIERPARR